jgi:hypothetical protein
MNFPIAEMVQAKPESVLLLEADFPTAGMVQARPESVLLLEADFPTAGMVQARPESVLLLETDFPIAGMVQAKPESVLLLETDFPIAGMVQARPESVLLLETVPPVAEVAEATLEAAHHWHSPVQPVLLVLEVLVVEAERYLALPFVQVADTGFAGHYTLAASPLQIYNHYKYSEMPHSHLTDFSASCWHLIEHNSVLFHFYCLKQPLLHFT